MRAVASACVSGNPGVTSGSWAAESRSKRAASCSKASVSGSASNQSAFRCSPSPGSRTKRASISAVISAAVSTARRNGDA